MTSDFDFSNFPGTNISDSDSSDEEEVDYSSNKFRRAVHWFQYDIEFEHMKMRSVAKALKKFTKRVDKDSSKVLKLQEECQNLSAELGSKKADVEFLQGILEELRIHVEKSVRESEEIIKGLKEKLDASSVSEAGLEAGSES